MNRCILVVDDDKDTADSLAMLLGLWGYEAQAAYDGDSALATAKQRPPAAALIDLLLPWGMNGYALAQCLRADSTFGDTVLIAVTGLARPEDRERVRSAGFHHYFIKPAELALLQHVLAHIVCAPRTGISSRRSVARTLSVPG